MEINDILNGFNGSDCDDKGCNINKHHNNCTNNCSNNNLLLLLLLLGGNGCGQQMNQCCSPCYNPCCNPCCCEKPKFKKVKQTVYYPENNFSMNNSMNGSGNGNNLIWLIVLLGLCGNNNGLFGLGNSCKC